MRVENAQFFLLKNDLLFEPLGLANYPILNGAYSTLHDHNLLLTYPLSFSKELIIVYDRYKKNYRENVGQTDKNDLNML